jgi:putative transposase
MRTPILVKLSADERTYLDRMIRAGSAPARVQARARILLLADRSQGGHMSDDEVAQVLRVHPRTVYNTRRRYRQEGLDSALYEKPRPGQPPKITGDVEAALIVLACSDPPDGCDRWTLNLLANKLIELELVESISPVAVYKRLKKTLYSRGV